MDSGSTYKQDEIERDVNITTPAGEGEKIQRLLVFLGGQ